MFNPRSFDNSRPDGIAVLEVVPDPSAEAGAPALFVPLKRTELTGDVAGPVGSLRVRHVFGYSKEQSDKVLEAVYRFPLPGDAAVTGVRVRFGDVEIRADLKERQRAEQDYDEARRVRDEVNDPYLEQRVAADAARSGRTMQAATKALVSSLPAIMGALGQVEQELERAVANIPDPTYPRR